MVEAKVEKLSFEQGIKTTRLAKTKNATASDKLYTSKDFKTLLL